MRRSLFIAGSGAEAAAATVACALGFAFRARGLRVGVMKPVETGCSVQGGTVEPASARALALAAACDDPIDLICPYRYRSELAAPMAAEADGAAPPDLERIAECFRTISFDRDIVVVDGSGGLAVPIADDINNADVAAALGLETVIVAANHPSCLNSSLLSVKYAQSRRLKLAGYIVADTEAGTAADERTEKVLARLTNVRCLGRMRYREPLALAIVEQLL